jgi:hypothetical protein
MCIENKEGLGILSGAAAPLIGCAYQKLYPIWNPALELLESNELGDLMASD